MVHERDSMIFLDEASFKVSYRRTRGRSLKGTRAVTVVKGLRTENFSLVAGISTNDVVHYSCIQGAYNSNYFAMFVESTLLILGTVYLNYL
jgi:hypothetical protein